jgi:hypothetical protein
MGVISVQLRFEERKQARFGYRMSRLTLDSACVPANAERIMEMCQSASVEMLTLRVPTDKVALVEALEFRIMDCLVYYECHRGRRDCPALLFRLFQSLPRRCPSTAKDVFQFPTKQGIPVEWDFGRHGSARRFSRLNHNNGLRKNMK